MRLPRQTARLSWLKGKTARTPLNRKIRGLGLKPLGSDERNIQLRRRCPPDTETYGVAEGEGEAEGEADSSVFSVFFFAVVVVFFFAVVVVFLAAPVDDVDAFFSVWVEAVVVLAVSVLFAQPLIKIAAAPRVDTTTKWVFMTLVSHGTRVFDKTNPGGWDYSHLGRKMNDK